MGSTYLKVVYATDEDVFNESSADWATIVPKSNRYAAGSDGVFAAATGGSWVLTAASSRFAAQGVVSGQVVQLTLPGQSGVHCFAVDSASDSTGLTLRRCGFALGEGLPPAPSGGLNSVGYLIVSLKPQIERVAYELNQRYALDPNLANRRSADVYDQRVFRRLTALQVLYLQYAGLNRAKAGDFADKVEFYHREYRAALETATVRWGADGNSQPATTATSCRISR